MENNNLEMYKLANLYYVINVDKHSQQDRINNKVYSSLCRN